MNFLEWSICKRSVARRIDIGQGGHFFPCVVVARHMTIAPRYDADLVELVKDQTHMLC